MRHRFNSTFASAGIVKLAKIGPNCWAPIPRPVDSGLRRWRQSLGQRCCSACASWISKKPYSAFFLRLAGLGSWSQFKTNVAIFSSWAQRQLRHTQSKTQWTVQAIQAWLRTHWNRIVWLIRNLWKDTEKSMTSSKLGPYYFEPNKKHLELPLSAWFIWLFLVGDTSFELVTPAVWMHLLLWPGLGSTCIERLATKPCNTSTW